MSGPPQIFPPLPINEPGSTSPGPVVPSTLVSGTGLSQFESPQPVTGVPPTPDLTPPDAYAFTKPADAPTDVVVPGLASSVQGPLSSSITVEPYPQPPPLPPQPGPPHVFLPTDIAGLQLWLRADLGITIATGVSEWDDQSGTDDPNKNVTQAIGAQQPSFNANDPSYSFKPTLGFISAADQFLASAAWTSPLALPETIFIVGNSDGLVSNEYFSDGIVANSRATSTDIGSTRWAIFNGAFLDSGLGLSSAPMAAVGYFDTGAASKVYVSTLTPQATGNAGTAVATRTGLTVGHSPAGAPLNGKIAEVIIYSGALSTSDFRSVMIYLGTRYGIAIGP